MDEVTQPSIHLLSGDVLSSVSHSSLFLPLSVDVHAHRGDQVGLQEGHAQGTDLDAPGRPFVYRVTMVVMHLGWVDLDLLCSTLLLGSM